MTSTTPRIITIALATLAIAAPAATAMPVRDTTGVETSSLAGTTSAPKQDLRNADNRAPVYVPPAELAPNMVPPVVQHPYAADQLKPISSPVKATDGDDGTSPFVFIIPAVVLIAMLGAGVAFARTSRPARRSPA